MRSSAASSFFARRPEVALGLVTLVWGSTFVVTKDVVRTIAPLPYTATRFGLAAVALLTLVPSARRGLVDGRVLRSGALLGVAQALALLLQVYGQVYTTASKAAFLTSMCTLLTPLVAYALHGERPRVQQLAGIALASGGLALLTWPGADAASGWNDGDSYMLGCAAVYAWITVETARRAKQVDPVELAGVQIPASALTLLACLALSRVLLAHIPAGHRPALLALEVRPFAPPLRGWLQIAYMALACTVLTYTVQNWALRRMTATRGAVVYALEPVFATALAVLVEGRSEWPGPRGAAGALLILVGVLSSEMRWVGAWRSARARARRSASSPQHRAETEGEEP